MLQDGLTLTTLTTLTPLTLHRFTALTPFAHFAITNAPAFYRLLNRGQREPIGNEQLNKYLASLR